LILFTNDLLADGLQIAIADGMLAQMGELKEAV